MCCFVVLTCNACAYRFHPVEVVTISILCPQNEPDLRETDDEEDWEAHKWELAAAARDRKPPHKIGFFEENFLVGRNRPAFSCYICMCLCRPPRFTTTIYEFIC